jgi:hypothetical protein
LTKAKWDRPIFPRPTTAIFTFLVMLRKCPESIVSDEDYSGAGRFPLSATTVQFPSSVRALSAFLAASAPFAPGLM